MWLEAYCFRPVRECLHPCVHHVTLLSQYLAEYLTNFHQTYINNALWDRDERFTNLHYNDVLWDGDECIKFWGEKVEILDALCGVSLPSLVLH